MPTLPFDFAGAANSSGVVTITKAIPVGPVRIAITRFTLRTYNGCHDRTHHLTVRVNSDTIFQGAMHDCRNLTLESNQSWRGVMQLSFTANGFSPGETMQGGGSLDFRVELF